MCFLRDGDRAFLTYSTTGRGNEPVDASLGLLDMTAYGRREAWRTTPLAGPTPLRPTRRSVGMARRSAGTGARTPTASPPGARPAAPCRSGPAPAQPPWRPSAGTATTTDTPSSTASAKVLGAGRNLRTMRTAPPAAYRSLAVGPEGRRHQDQEVSTHSALPADASRRCANNRLSKPPDRLASDDWQDSGLVFTTALGNAMDAANVWRDLRRALGLVPGIVSENGRRGSYRTLSYRCCPTSASRSSRSRSSSATAGPRSPSWSTGTSCGPSSRPARPSWTAFSLPTRDRRSQAGSQAAGLRLSMAA